MSECNGAHTWHQISSWRDTASSRWIEKECQKCGIRSRERDNGKPDS